MTLEEIRARLRTHKLTIVAEETGISYSVLYRIYTGRQNKPDYETVLKIVEFLKR